MLDTTYSKHARANTQIPTQKVSWNLRHKSNNQILAMLPSKPQLPTRHYRCCLPVPSCQQDSSDVALQAPVANNVVATSPSTSLPQWLTPRRRHSLRFFNLACEPAVKQRRLRRMYGIVIFIVVSLVFSAFHRLIWAR